MRFVLVSSTGERVKKAREDAGLSQSHLGEAVGASQQVIAKIESGGVRNSSFLPKIAEVLGTTYDFLRYGTTPDTSSNVSNTSKSTSEEEFITTALDALNDAIISVRAYRVGKGDENPLPEKELLSKAFEIALRGRITGDYLSVILKDSEDNAHTGT